MKRTPLYEEHVALGAKMVNFAGFDMPVSYTSVLAEHKTVREAVGLFDISHMGEIMVTGPQAKDFINRVTTNNISKIGDGRCQYSVCCYEDGGIVDDVITYQFDPQKYMVVVNASNIQKDWDWFLKNKMEGVALTDTSDDTCQLALQGPFSAKVLQPLIDIELEWFSTFRFQEISVDGVPCLVSRTGYTGEDGFEIYASPKNAKHLWALFLEAGSRYGIKPIGLAARDTLRLEAAFPLYGHEISATINPYEAKLGWVVSLDKGDFIGKQSLAKIKQQGPLRQLVGLEMVEAGIPREGYEIFAEGKKIGVVTSGTFSPSRNKAIAMALIDSQEEVASLLPQVKIRNKWVAAKVVALPFYKRQSNN